MDVEYLNEQVGHDLIKRIVMMERRLLMGDDMEVHKLCKNLDVLRQSCNACANIHGCGLTKQTSDGSP